LKMGLRVTTTSSEIFIQLGAIYIDSVRIASQTAGG